MKFLRYSVFVLSLFISSISFTGLAFAQVPPPPVSCRNINTPNTEFHSLRPYQASVTCQTEVAEKAKFCGGNLTLKDTITVNYSPGQEGCQENGDKIQCTYTVPVRKTISIDLSGAELPIMGNTEDVTNSQNDTEQIDDAEKINEYVSWYLSGVTNKAEYAAEDNPDKIINYSGPIQKLLPAKIQEDKRVETIKKAGVTRHDQVIGCHNLIGQITPCYPERLGVIEVKLSNWKNNLPPDRSKYENAGDYFIAYKRWRGDACASIFGASLCIDVPWKPNWPGNLFQNIPFSSTEDTKGNVAIDPYSVSLTGNSETKIKNVSFSGQTPAELFFAHMEEADELGSILQDTFAQKGADKVGDPTLVSLNTSCKDVEIRSNEGDNLFATGISGTLSYSATFSCEFNKSGTNGTSCFERCLAEGRLASECGSECSAPNASNQSSQEGQQTCSKDIFINLSTTSQTPKADSIWSRLVAGPASIFKRIFPKTNTSGSVGKIIDIPGSTNVTYTGATTSNTDLKFPHIGGISEYFLKGIQTALRPKGFGEPIAFAEEDGRESSGEVDCDQSAPDINLPNVLNKNQLHNLAVRWIGGREGDHIIECYNDVARKSLAKGIDPAFTFFMWIHESGGSNYNISNQDWGINDSTIVGFTAQLDRFLELPSSYGRNYRECFGKGNDTLSYFDLYYLGLQGGQCVPGAGQYYMDALKIAWDGDWITTCPQPQYPFSASCY